MIEKLEQGMSKIAHFGSEIDRKTSRVAPRFLFWNEGVGRGNLLISVRMRAPLPQP
jgi:hypothetical protein